MLPGQAERDRPEWPVLRNEAASLERCLQDDEDGSPLGELRQSASALATLLRNAASRIIRELDAGQSFQEFLFAPEMVVIPSGTFMMGSPESEEGRHDDEGPQHEVTFARHFAVGRYPVTFEEYDRFAEATGREPPNDAGSGRGRRPVINVLWDDAQAYVAWLSEQTGQPYRLLSEAEWEYACRAGTTTRFSWGDEITHRNANYGYDNTSGTTEVGSYPPNPWGLYDMHGNVRELIEDSYHFNYDNAPADGSPWVDGGEGGLARSAAWIGPDPRSAYRGYWFPSSGDPHNWRSNFGFRVARTLY